MFFKTSSISSTDDNPFLEPGPLSIILTNYRNLYQESVGRLVDLPIHMWIAYTTKILQPIVPFRSDEAQNERTVKTD